MWVCEGGNVECVGVWGVCGVCEGGGNVATNIMYCISRGYT